MKGDRAVIVCGGRDFQPNSSWRKLLVAWLKLLDAKTVIHGGARGADMFGAAVAESLGLKTRAFLPDWEQHGKAAGHIRNTAMANEGAMACIAFPGGAGTADMVRKAQARRIAVVRMRCG